MESERRERHIKELRKNVPSLDDSFAKPQNAGRKPGYHKRQRNQAPPSMVVDRLRTFSNESIADQNQPGSPSHISSQSRSQVIAESSSQVSAESMSHVAAGSPSQVASESDSQIVSFIDPRTQNEKEFELHMRATLSKGVKGSVENQ